jgi:hypothetical protein
MRLSQRIICGKETRMSIPQVIEAAVGLVVVYYILGLVVSFITSRITEALETRGRDLEDQLKKIVGEAKLGDLIAQPQIKSLAPIRYLNWQGIFTGQLKEAKIEKIPVSNLVDAVFDLYDLIDKPYTAEELKTLLNSLPPSESKTILLKWIDQEVIDVDQLRAKASMWLAGLMDQVAATYKAHARQFVVGLSLIITLLFGVDSIDFGMQMWHNADLRAIANAKAELYLNQAGTAADVGPLLQDLQNLSLQIGWWAVPRSIPQEAAASGWILWVLKKIAGLTITVVAVSQGSSFWYDILCRLKAEKATPADESKSDGGAAPEK